MITTSTSTRDFKINTQKLASFILEVYGIKAVNIKEFSKGYSNLNLLLSTDLTNFVIRFYGYNNDQIEVESETSIFLSSRGINTPKLIKTLDAKAYAEFDSYIISIFTYIDKAEFELAKISPKKLALSINELSKELSNFKPHIIKKNRFFFDEIIFKSKLELLKKNYKELEKISRKDQIQTFDEDIHILESLALSNSMTNSVIHSDIYSNNLGIDLKGDLVFFDFEYIGIGPQIIDLCSVAAWEFFNNDVINWDYTSDYFKSLELIKEYSSKDIFDWLIYLNLVDNLFNWEKSLKSKSNKFEGYLANHLGAKNIVKSKDKILSILM